MSGVYLYKIGVKEYVKETLKILFIYKNIAYINDFKYNFNLNGIVISFTFIIIIICHFSSMELFDYFCFIKF